jgi:hypothetical protein
VTKWHVSGVETTRIGILVEADSAAEAQALAEEIDVDQWTDGGVYEFIVDHVSPWDEG